MEMGKGDNMKVQKLKMEGEKKFTVIMDTERDWTEQYAIYIHLWRPNKNGVYTRRKYLVDRCHSMKMCLAWIMDILSDDKILANAISAKQILAS